jgi:tetratricopeptide (TPR) repeat protein
VDAMASEVDPKVRQNAETFFQYGNDAVLKSNYDYAIDMFLQACRLIPDELKYRIALRGAERKKLNNDPSKVGMLAAAKNKPIRLLAAQARSKGRFDQALDTCEKAFLTHPWDVSISREAAESAEAAGYLKLAQWYLESVQAQANDVEFHRHIAHVHELNENWQKAINAWEAVRKLVPDDEDASRKINALSASSTMQKGKYTEAIDRSVQTREREAVEAAREAELAKVEELRQKQLTPEQKWMQSIKEDPTVVPPYLHLADSFKRRGQLEEADKIISRGLKAVGDDSALMAAYSEIRIARIDEAIERIAAKHRERPHDPEFKQKLEQANKLRIDYEIKELKRRVSLKPEDNALHLELGLALAKADQHHEAIGEFQKARNEPELKVKALYHAGLSFEANGAYKLAERSYHEALRSLTEDDKENFNAIHYRLGRVAEAVENYQIAEEHYNEVAANDYTYLDVAQRLRNLN